MLRAEPTAPIQPSRRQLFGALAAVAAMGPMAPAHAIVEGIPFYAPGASILLPDEGFEGLLPKLEVIRDRLLPALREAIEAENWKAVSAAVATGERGALTKMLAVLGQTASILGDEAYTALDLKADFAAAAKRLGATASAAASGGSADVSKAALVEADALGKTLVDFIALVPAEVVEQVRKRQEKERQQRLKEEEAAAAAAAEAEAEAE